MTETGLSMSKEAYFIAQFSSKHIGDDGALVHKTVYSKDLFCEGIHFKRSWMSIEQIARKSMLVNISDAIAMNAEPRLALIGIVIPKDFTCNALKELALGFEKVAQEYGIEIIGGDTTSGASLMISVTIVSDTKKPLQRKNAKMGDLVAYTGTLGESSKGLQRLLRGGYVSKNARFKSPVLKRAFMQKIGHRLHAGMDISDGLSKDLSRLCKESRGVGIQWKKKLSKREMCSGEEYEILFTFSPRDKEKIKRVCAQTRTKMTIIGKIIRKRYRCVCKEHHFK